MTQSMPAIVVELALLPLQSTTRTATSFAFFATPYVEPPTTPDTVEP